MLRGNKLVSNDERKKRYDEVWCVVMFDLPVLTKEQRKQATKFRKMLVDLGYSMIQFSVYGKYSPSISSNMKNERFLKDHLPSGGEVRIFHLTDTQWASATRFRSQKRAENKDKPEQIMLF